MAYTLLIIEDNVDIARLIQFHVQDLGCHADIAPDGNQALEMFRQNSYQLVILDLMLPGLGGLEVCKQLRAQTSYIPILMLTSKSSEHKRQNNEQTSPVPADGGFLNFLYTALLGDEANIREVENALHELDCSIPILDSVYEEDDDDLIATAADQLAAALVDDPDPRLRHVV